MIYAYDEPVALPTVDLYDSTAMQLYINAAREMYKQSQEEQKEFLKNYGDFYSPIANDVDNWYNSIVAPLKSLIADAQANGIDLTRSQEGRALLAKYQRAIPYGELAKMKQSAKAAELYMAAVAEAKSKGLYSDEMERWDIARNGGVDFENWDSRKNGIWTRVAPIQYKSLHDFVDPVLDNIKPYMLSKEEVEGEFGKKYDPDYDYIGVAPSRLEKSLKENMPGLVGSPYWDYYYEKARQDLIADGNNNPSDAEIKDRFVKNSIVADYERVVNPIAEINELVKMQKDFDYKVRLDNIRTANDIRVKRTPSASGNGNQEYGTMSIWEEAMYRRETGASEKGASYSFGDEDYHRISPAHAGVTIDKNGVYTIPQNALKSEIFALNDVYGDGKVVRNVTPKTLNKDDGKYYAPSNPQFVASGHMIYKNGKFYITGRMRKDENSGFYKTNGVDDVYAMRVKPNMSNYGHKVKQ